MKLTFIGTSHGFAEADRTCSSTLLEVSDTAYLIDAGSAVDHALMKMEKDVCCIKDIFITHMHEDHVGCLTSAVKSYLRYDKMDKIKIFFPEQSGIDGFKAWNRALRLNICDDCYKLIQPGEFFKDGNISVRAIKTEHVADLTSYAFIFEADGKKIGFSGDFSGNGDFHDYPAEFCNEKFDLIVCEMAHFQTEKAIEKIKNSNTKTMIFNHIRSQDKVNEVSQYFKDLPFDVKVSYDGMQYEI